MSILPLEVWKKDFISDGPSTFLPINKISSRCLACCGRLACSDLGTEENVMFVSPLPSMHYF